MLGVLSAQQPLAGAFFLMETKPLDDLKGNKTHTHLIRSQLNYAHFFGSAIVFETAKKSHRT